MSGSFAAEYYLDHLASTVDGLEPLRVLIDCANGAASTTARYLFGRFPLEAEYLNDKRTASTSIAAAAQRIWKRSVTRSKPAAMTSASRSTATPTAA